MPVFFRLTITIIILFFSGYSAAKEMTFGILYMMQKNIVVADGDITSDTPKRFRDFLSTNPFDGSFFVVALNSPGGDVLGGLELGRLIRSENLHTTVLKFHRHPSSGELIHESEEAGDCFSACALAYIGGNQRDLIPKSKLGFHQFSSAKGSLKKQSSVLISEASSQALGAVILNYIVEMGINPRLYSTMSSTLPFDIYIPEPVELRSLNIISKKAFQDFGFEPYGKGVIAYAKFPENAVGRNQVSQITTYCKDGIPYLLLGREKWEPRHGEIAKKFANEQMGFTIHQEGYAEKVEYGPNSVTVRTGGQPIAEIRLDGQGSLLLTQKSFGSIEVAATLGIYSFNINPSKEDIKKIEASFRICIN